MKITMEYIRFITVANLKREANYPRIAALLPLTCYDTKQLVSQLNGLELKILLRIIQIGKFDEEQLFEMEELQEYCMLVGKELFFKFFENAKSCFFQIQLQIQSGKPLHDFKFKNR